MGGGWERRTSCRPSATSSDAVDEMLDGFVAAHRDLVRLAAPRVVVPNFGLAAEMAIAEGIEVREVQVTDDVASASSAEMSGRRGIAGDIYVFECIGAAAERALRSTRLSASLARRMPRP